MGARSRPGRRWSCSTLGGTGASERKFSLWPFVYQGRAKPWEKIPWTRKSLQPFRVRLAVTLQPSRLCYHFHSSPPLILQPWVQIHRQHMQSFFASDFSVGNTVLASLGFSCMKSSLPALKTEHDIPSGMWVGSLALSPRRLHSRAALLESGSPGCVSLSQECLQTPHMKMNLNPLSIPTGFLPDVSDGVGGGWPRSRTYWVREFLLWKSRGFPLAREEIRSFPRIWKKKGKKKQANHHYKRNLFLVG